MRPETHQGAIKIKGLVRQTEWGLWDSGMSAPCLKGQQLLSSGQLHMDLGLSDLVFQEKYKILVFM